MQSRGTGHNSDCNGQMDALNENIERLIEQVRIADSYRFGRHTEKLEAIDRQFSFFDEADAIYDGTAPEPAAEEVLPPKSRRKKTRGQRETDLKDFPTEVLEPYSVSEEEPDAFYGMGNWKRMPDETYKRLRHEPESWTVEIHTVEVYVGTDGEHQDEFLRGDRPKDLLRGSIVTPSLAGFHLKCEVCEFCTAIPHRTGIFPQRRQHFQTDHGELDHQERP